MGKKRELMKALPDAKEMEKRLQRYGEGHARDKFGKKTNLLAKAKPLSEFGAASPLLAHIQEAILGPDRDRLPKHCLPGRFRR